MSRYYDAGGLCRYGNDPAMSVPRTCPPCMQGNHAGHDRNWNIEPGRIGGAYCPCEGECVNLPDPTARMFAAYPSGGPR